MKKKGILFIFLLLLLLSPIIALLVPVEAQEPPSEVALQIYEDIPGELWHFKTLDNNKIKIKNNNGVPEFTLFKWGEEVSLSGTVVPIGGEVEFELEVEKNKVKWTGKWKVGGVESEVEIEFEPTAIDDGGLEWNTIIFDNSVNTFSIHIQSEGLRFTKQLPLTQEEIDAGCSRPENIVGSYAVYHESKKNNEYMTGKAFHIYRPLVIDALGAETWADLDISDGILTITVSQQFLDEAVYPVTVDPDFGYTTIGESWTTLAYYSDCNRVGSAWTMPAPGGTANFIRARVYGSSGITCDVKVLVNQKDSGGSGTHGQIAIKENLACAEAEHWEEFTLSSETLTSGVVYILNMVGDPADAPGPSDNYNVRYDANGAGAVASYYESHSSYTPQSPWVEDPYGTLMDFSIYCDYNAFTLPTITSATITDMDDTDNCYEMEQHYAFQVVVADLDGADTIANVSLRILDGATIMGEVIAATLDGIPAYSIVYNGTEIDLDAGSCSWNEDGNTGTATFKIRFEWDFTDTADLELSVFVEDEDGAEAGWTEMQSDYFDVIGRLVTINFVANATYVERGDGVELTGSVRYATTVGGNIASSYYPLDAQFTSVDIHDAGDVERGTDGTIVDGAFSVEFTIPDAVQTNVYHVFLDLVDDYTDADAPDGDEVTVYGVESILLFSFDEEVSLTITNDTSGVGNDGTISGANRTGMGKYGKAMAFDGLNDYINVTDSASLDIIGTITMSTWIYTTDPNTQVILEKKGAYGLSIEPSFGIRVTINTTHVDTAINIFNASEWTYVTGQYNGSHVNIYINAVLVRSQAMTGSIAATATHLYVGNQTNSFNGTLGEIRIYGYVISQPDLAIYMATALATFPHNLQGSITDMEADDWVFAGDEYTFVCTYVTENVTTYPFDTLALGFYDGVSWTFAYYDDVEDTWSMTSGVAHMVAVLDSTDGNEITVTFTIHIRDTIFDVYNVDLYMYCNVTTADEDDWEINRADYFNIYNLGGKTEVDYGGDGGHVVGGGIFDVAAQNSSTGSYAAANVTYRKFQHVRIVTHLWTNTSWDGSHWDCPAEHANTGYVEYPVYYYANNTMMEGWKVRLGVIDGKADANGAWVKVNVTWYNRGVYVSHDEIYAYYEASLSTHNNTQFALCIDLWVDIEDASSVVRGRVSPEYYGMEKTGFLFWAEWNPMLYAGKVSTFSAPLLSSDPAYGISARSVSLFKVGVIINKTSPDAGDPDCDEHLWALRNTDIDWRYLGPDEAMVGIDSPIPMETISPFEPKTGYFSSLVNALVEGITTPIVSVIERTMGAAFWVISEVIDAGFSSIGVKRFVSSITTTLKTYGGYFADSLTNMTSLVTQMFRIIGGVSTFLITWLTRMITVFLDMWRIAGEVAHGTSTLLGGMGDVWAIFFASGAIIEAAPIFIAIGWLYSIDQRAKRVGGGWMSFLIGDLQMVSWVLSFMVEWFTRVIEFVIARVMQFINILRV